MPSVNSDDVEHGDDEPELGEQESEEQEGPVDGNGSPNATQDKAGNDAEGEEGTDDSGSDESVSPSILDDMSEIGFDETRHGHDYALLKSEFDRQQNWMDMLVVYIQQKNKETKEDKKKIKKLEEELEEAQDRLKGIRKPVVPWSQLLRSYLSGGDISYNQVYRRCCKQENMSQQDIFHPDLFVIKNTISDNKRGREERRLLEDRTPRPSVQERAQSVAEPDSYPAAPSFPFEKLPLKVQVKIFRRLFVKNSLIHCLSRLDPENPPVGFPDKDVEGQSQLPTRFHFGTSPCQIILTRKPNDVLGPLLVCKRWYFIGAHAFYGGNTFAFSSLGEWHRFGQGIGKARVQRLVNVELMWHGALMPPHETHVSQRTLGLYSFTETRRLRTVVVHISECSKSRTRRGYEVRRGKKNPFFSSTSNNTDGSEPAEDQSSEHQSDDNGPEDIEDSGNRILAKHFDAFKTMVRRTRTHPNYRKYRSMRTVQGIDCLYQLRGMNWIRFKESNGPIHRQSARDWSFLKDINTVVTLPKEEYDLRMSHLEDSRPSQEDMEIVKKFYDETPCMDLVGGSETTGSANGDGSDIVSWNGSSVDGSEDDDDDGDDNAGGRSVPRPSRGANTVTVPRPAQGRNNQTQADGNGDGNGDGGDGMDIDDDRSSALFVPSGSGSVGPPSERMDIDDPAEQANSEVIDLAGGQSRIQADDNDHGDGAESPLFVPSEPDSRPSEQEPKTKSIKSEPNDNPGINGAPGCLVTDDSDSDSDPEEETYARDETPPGSDDDDDDFPLGPCNVRRPNPSPSSTGSSSSAKRRKLG
ncbi:uncharacterized protein F4812DRAFT_464962 [Daldinia caldariorum]|uniref:uncharacterized protein n=1 Tax=Daldinia caldariorum TaxID=326644 RepID=UPI0020082990|nr:uncharacterized protein F4812DRAFT_464962 [Daldinia caldariorum]KAI1473025.1 hypothetical protein F4812DRAFT_464962 [Daldinia caldariorum]